jgi:hypothetical protein
MQEHSENEGGKGEYLGIQQKCNISDIRKCNSARREQYLSEINVYFYFNYRIECCEYDESRNAWTVATLNLHFRSY